MLSTAISEPYFSTISIIYSTLIKIIIINLFRKNSFNNCDMAFVNSRKERLMKQLNVPKGENRMKLHSSTQEVDEPVDPIDRLELPKKDGRLT